MKGREGTCGCTADTQSTPSDTHCSWHASPSRRQESPGGKQHNFQCHRTAAGSPVCRAAGRPLCTTWSPPHPDDSRSNRTLDSPRATMRPMHATRTGPGCVYRSPHTIAGPSDCWVCLVSCCRAESSPGMHLGDCKETELFNWNCGTSKTVVNWREFPATLRGRYMSLSICLSGLG